MPRPPRPKYQVFISSTFRDLQAEREAVTWAIMKARHIPAGMEAFPATDDRGWKLIQREIDVTDYYILILAGRYGSVDSELGMSWTEREYDYAVSQGIKVLAFIRSDDAITKDKTDPEHAEHLHAFISKVRGAHLCKDWSEKEDLVTKVTQALHNQIQDDQDEEDPPPGWWRGGAFTSPDVTEELARLSKENDQLRSENTHLKKNTKEQPEIRILGEDKTVYQDGREYTVRLPSTTTRASRGNHLLFFENTGLVPCEHMVMHLAISGVRNVKHRDVLNETTVVLQEHEKSGRVFKSRTTITQLNPGEKIKVSRIAFNYVIRDYHDGDSLSSRVETYTITFHITGSHGVDMHQTVTFKPEIVD